MMTVDLRRLTVLFSLLPTLVLAAAPATGATFTVNTADEGADAQPGDGVCAAASGLCTLRAAIQEANASPGLDTIGFTIGSGPQRISVTSALPVIIDPVVIDGTTQPGYVRPPIVEVHGAGTRATGLVIVSGGSTVRRLVINGFAGNGLRLSGGGGNVVEGNYIGTDIAGMSAVPNLGSGVLIENSPDNIIQLNLISGNEGSGNTGGVRIEGPTSSRNTIQSCLHRHRHHRPRKIGESGARSCDQRRTEQHDSGQRHFRQLGLWVPHLRRRRNRQPRGR